MALDFGMTRVDGIKCALKATLQHVLKNNLPNGVNAVTDIKTTTDFGENRGLR